MCFWRRKNGITKLCKEAFEPSHSGSGGLRRIGNAGFGIVLDILHFGSGPCRGLS